MSSSDIDKDENKQLSIHASSSLIEQKKSFEEIYTKENQKRVRLSRYLKTIALCCAFFMSGYDITIWGLALPTLAENIQKTVADFTVVIFARGAGFLSGSLAIGLTDGFMDTELAISLAFFTVAVGLVFIPTILNFASLIIFSFVVSFGLGAYETVGNVFCIKLWGDEAQSVIQLVHLFFCFGCVVAPLTAKPFLNEVQNTTLNNDTEIFRDVIYVGDTNLPYLSVIYIIVAAIGFFLAVYFLFLKFFFESASGVEEEEIEKDTNKWFRYKMLAFMYFLFFFYIGTYITIATFLYTFAVSDVPGARHTKNQGSDLNTVYLGGITAGQFLSVLAAKKFSPTFNIATNLSALTVISFVLLFLPYYADFMAILWVLLALHGVFASSIFGYLFSWANQYIVMDGRAASMFIIGGSCGEMVLPLLLGFFINDDPMYFLYALFLYVVILMILFLSASRIARSYGSKTERNEQKCESSEACIETEY